jgi:hypothetical protein
MNWLHSDATEKLAEDLKWLVTTWKRAVARFWIELLRPVTLLPSRLSNYEYNERGRFCCLRICWLGPKNSLVIG